MAKDEKEVPRTYGDLELPVHVGEPGLRLVNGGPSSSLRQDPPAAWAGCRPAGAQMATRIGSSQHQGSDQTTPILLILDSKDLNLDSKDLNLDL